MRLQEWLNFIATELHKAMWPLYMKTATPELVKFVRDRVALRLGYAARHLAGPYLMGEQFTVASGYMFYVLRTWQAVAHRCARRSTPRVLPAPRGAAVDPRRAQRRGHHGLRTRRTFAVSSSGVNGFARNAPSIAAAPSPV